MISNSCFWTLSAWGPQPQCERLLKSGLKHCFIHHPETSSPGLLWWRLLLREWGSLGIWGGEGMAGRMAPLFSHCLWGENWCKTSPCEGPTCPKPSVAVWTPSNLEQLSNSYKMPHLHRHLAPLPNHAHWPRTRAVWYSRHNRAREASPNLGTLGKPLQLPEPYFCHLWNRDKRNSMAGLGRGGGIRDVSSEDGCDLINMNSQLNWH